MTVTLLTDRQRRPPWGLAGGSDGAPGRSRLRRASGETVELPSKVELKLFPGDQLTIETPGGGGWGSPRSRQ